MEAGKKVDNDLKFDVKIVGSQESDTTHVPNDREKCFVIVRSLYSQLGGNLEKEKLEPGHQSTGIDKPETVCSKIEFEGVLVLTIPIISPGGLTR